MENKEKKFESQKIESKKAQSMTQNLGFSEDDLEIIKEKQKEMFSISDEKTRQKIIIIASEIENFSDDEIVDMLKLFPANIAYDITRQFPEEKQKRVNSLMEKVYKQDFETAISKKYKSGKTKFDERTCFKKLNDKIKKGEDFRLLTTEELVAITDYKYVLCNLKNYPEDEKLTAVYKAFVKILGKSYPKWKDLFEGETEYRLNQLLESLSLDNLIS
ncbi:MAG: hypothetical protein ACI4L6_01055 [Candidatus Onthoplasma sp.]